MTIRGRSIAALLGVAIMFFLAGGFSLLFFIVIVLLLLFALREAERVAASAAAPEALGRAADKAMEGALPAPDARPASEDLSRAFVSMKKARALIGRLNSEINSRRQAEEALARSDEHFINALHASHDAILIIRDGQFVDCNDTAVRMLGYATREEFLGIIFSGLFPAAQPDGSDSVVKIRQMMQVAFAEGFHRFEWVCRKAGGEDFPVQVSLTPVVVRGQTVLHCVWIDLTRQKQDDRRLREAQQSLEVHAAQLAASLQDALRSREMLTSMLEDNNSIRQELERHLKELKLSQNRLINSEKLASLGRLVSEIAHEVNNPLMIISGNAQLSLMLASISEEEKSNLEIIVKECQRAKNVIRRVLRFARPSKGEVREVEAGESIDMVVGILEKQFMMAHNVRIRKEYLGKSIHIAVDEQQMQEVFMNLLNNAKDAMPRGGEITISAAREGAMVRIDFKDTGTGMSDEVIRKIMEPFFTTKETGTGIGLAICYGIVHNAHGGELRFESEEGKGTTATILLPAQGVQNNGANV